MTQQLLIPEKIKVGFQNRQGTYTGKLAYVIYYDQKGKLRKETSWQSWRDDKIDPVEYVNEPIDGFVLNKGVGGQRQSYGWNARNEYIRVYDPRDFEFEISVANLLFILRECDCSRGKGLEGKFVYAWDGTELVLLPERSQDYKNSKNFTQLQACKVKAKELIPGASYVTKRQKILTYLGRFDYYFVVAANETRKNLMSGVQKKHVFWDDNPEQPRWEGAAKPSQFVFLDDLKSIATLNSDAVVSNYAELVEKYNKSPYGSKVVKLFTKPSEPPKDNNQWYYSDRYAQELIDGWYLEYYTQSHYYGRTKNQVVTCCRYMLKDGIIIAHGEHKYDDKVSPDWKRLYAQLESGAEYQLNSSNLLER